MTDVLTRAREFAVLKHGSQTRKDGKTPYTTHLDGVVQILQDGGITDETTLAGGYLHDVLEDTPCTDQELLAIFGEDIDQLVRDCSRNSAEHRDVYVNHFRVAHPSACLIKLADRLYNLCDWNGMDPGYRPKYAAEGMEIVCRILRNEKTKRWTDTERACAKKLMDKILYIFLDETQLGSELTLPQSHFEPMRDESRD